MKSVLISIQPKWCELIASGKKTIEARKTRPKIDTPFKCYIYCTLSGSNEFFKEDCNGDIAKWNKSKMALKKGKVIGEFVCDKIYDVIQFGMGIAFGDNGHIIEPQLILNEACLTEAELEKYFELSGGYAWHISNLVIYDKPKELSGFITICPEWEKEYFDTKCLRCKYYFSNCADMRHECTVEGEKALTRPPQSWCYVEELEVLNDPTR